MIVQEQNGRVRRLRRVPRLSDMLRWLRRRLVQR